MITDTMNLYVIHIELLSTILCCQSKCPCHPHIVFIFPSTIEYHFCTPHSFTYTLSSTPPIKDSSYFAHSLSLASSSPTRLYCSYLSFHIVCNNHPGTSLRRGSDHCCVSLLADADYKFDSTMGRFRQVLCLISLNAFQGWNVGA